MIIVKCYINDDILAIYIVSHKIYKYTVYRYIMVHIITLQIDKSKINEECFSISIHILTANQKILHFFYLKSEKMHVRC